jgi:hypothetical protein
MLSPTRGSAGSNLGSPYSSPGTPTSGRSPNAPIVETLAIGLCLLKRSCGSYTQPPPTASEPQEEFGIVSHHPLLPRELADAEVACAVSRWNALPNSMSEDTEIILQHGNTLFGGPGFEYGSINNVKGLPALVALVQTRIAEFQRQAVAGDAKKFLFAFNSVPSSHFSQNPKTLFAATIKEFAKGSLHSLVLVPPSHGTIAHWEVILDGRFLTGTAQFQHLEDVRHLLVQLFGDTVAGRFFYCFFQESLGRLLFAGENHELPVVPQLTASNAITDGTSIANA